jgi:hypothetical protein
VTIQGSRRTAAAIAGAGVFWVIVLGLSALLLRQPTLLLFVALLALIFPLPVVLLLRPITLRFDGADLIYRFGGRETRVGGKDVAKCAQVGQAWVFSGADGAQLLTLPATRFSQSDVAAFCKQAGLNLQAPTVQLPVDRLRGSINSAKWTRVFGLILGVILVAAAGLALWSSRAAQDNLRSYKAAPACTTVLDDTSICRLQTQGRVTSTQESTSTRTLLVTLTETGANYFATINKSEAPLTGEVVNVEVWRANVTRLNEQDTVDNPEVNPNLNLNGVVAVIGLFAAIGFGVAVVGHVQVIRGREALRTAAAAESGSAGPVQAVHPEASVAAIGLPHCGIAHHPEEELFVHWDPKAERTGTIIAFVIAVIVLAILGALMYYVSVPIFGGIAAIGLAWFGLNLFGEWRERRAGGVFADDLHVGKLTTSNGRWVRKVYDRSSVLECNIAVGPTLTVVGVDGSTLFWTGAITAADMDRFVAFIGCKVNRETPPAQPDPIAAAPIRTRLGVLPLRVRRAAGLMQAAGGLMVGLSLINIPRMAGLSGQLRVQGLELLASFAIYGLVMVALGLALAQGMAHSREAAVVGGGVAAIFLPVASFVIYANPVVSAVFAALTVTAYGLVFYWLQEPEKS